MIKSKHNEIELFTIGLSEIGLSGILMTLLCVCGMGLGLIFMCYEVKVIITSIIDFIKFLL